MRASVVDIRGEDSERLRRDSAVVDLLLLLLLLLLIEKETELGEGDLDLFVVEDEGL